MAIITNMNAAGAYAAMQRMARPQNDPSTGGAGGTGGAPAAPGAVGVRPANSPVSFGEMVSQAVDGTLAAGHAAESKAIAMTEGRASIVDVATAVAETEVAVETLVAVRDKVISSYKDIMNMPI